MRRRLIARLAAVLAVAVVGCLTAGCAARMPRAGAEEAPGRVYVVKHFWHAGLVLRRADVPADVWPEALALPPSRWVEIGWGDRAYWTAARPTLRLALAAILSPTPGVLRLVTFDGPVSGDEPVLPIDLSTAQLAALARFIAATYASPGEPPIAVRALAGGGFEVFYAARGRYDLCHTSNRWTVEALRAAGLDVDDTGVITAGQALRRLRRAVIAPAAATRASPPSAR